jgi:adenylate kinase family enzyme
MPSLRVVVLGRGGSGKTTFCRALSAATGVPAIELDVHFWDATLRPLPGDEWTRRQQTLLTGQQWIADGDLGPYDVLTARLDRATHVVVLAPPAWVCWVRALRRGRESLAFWRWTLTWRRREWPRIEAAILSSPARPILLHLRTPREIADALHQRWPHR